MSKIKYYKNKNKKLEEFLDENIKECTEDEINATQIDAFNQTNGYNLATIIESTNDNDIEIIETEELESDITFEITGVKGKKKLFLTVNIYDESEIIKLDFEIKKETLKKLLKNLED
mgnify:FL=1